MPIVHFYGTLHPKHHRVNSGRAFGINWGSADLGFPLIMEGKIVDSEFEVSCNLPEFTQSMQATLLSRAGNLIRSYTDLISFSLGIGFTLTWDTIKTPDGAVLKLQKVNSPLADLCTSYTFPPQTAQQSEEFERVFRLVLAEPNLQGSMMDLADALANFHQTPINCGRVLDSLRKTIAPGVEPGPAWGIFQTLLRVSQSYRAFVTSNSTDYRHGDRENGLPEATMKQIFHRTWKIMDRFIEFRKRGSVQLPDDEFPELVEGQ